MVYLLMTNIMDMMDSNILCKNRVHISGHTKMYKIYADFCNSTRSDYLLIGLSERLMKKNRCSVKVLAVYD